MPLTPLLFNYGLSSQFEVICQSLDKLTPLEIGEATNAHYGNERSSVRNEKRRWGAITTRVDTNTEEKIQSMARLRRQFYIGGEPFLSGAKNPVVSPYILNVAPWNVVDGIGVVNGIADPLGGLNATTLTADADGGYVVQDLSSSVDVTRSAFYWVRRRTGTGAVNLSPPNGIGWQNIAATLTASWKRFRVDSAGTARQVGIQVVAGFDAVDVFEPFLTGDPVLCSVVVNGSKMITGLSDFEMNLLIREV